MNKIYWGTLHTEYPEDMRGKILKGEIPEVDQTYAFMNVAYPLNESSWRSAKPRSAAGAN